MAKYFNTKEELHNHYFDIFKDIVEAIANTEHVEDLNTFAIMFNKNTYIPFGRVMGDDIEEFENTYNHHLVSQEREHFKITKNAMNKFKCIKTFIGETDHNVYAYICIPSFGINTEQLHKKDIPSDEFTIVETSRQTWAFIKEYLLKNEENLDPYAILNFAFIDFIIHCSHKFTMSCKKTIEKVLADYGCIADDNYRGIMTINSRYYNIENTKLDFPKSANNEEKFKEIIDYISKNIKALNNKKAYTQIYFSFFDENKEKALYCKNLIVAADEYHNEVLKVIHMLQENNAEFIKSFEIKYNVFEP